MKIKPLVVGALLACSAGTAAAQITTEAVQPGRLDSKPTLRPRSNDVLTAPKTSTAVTGETRAIGKRIARVRVEGSSLSPEMLNKVIGKFGGSTIDADRVRAIADAISTAYSKSNVALYSILVPDQDFEGGVVRIVAVENHIDEVLLSGEGAGRASLTQAYANNLASERPLTRATLERNLLLMGDIPGVTMTPRVLQGESLDTVKLGLERSFAPVETVLTVDTRGAAQLGRMQFQGDVFLNGLFYEGNQTKISGAASADFERFLSASLSHGVTFGPNGLTASASAGYFRTRPDGGMEGDGQTFGLQAAYPLIRGARMNVQASGGIDGINSNNALFGQVLSSDRTRAARAALFASGTLGATSWGASGSVSHGLDSLGARITNPAFATLDFTKANLQASLSHPVGKDWRIDGAIASQLTGDTLPAAELWSLGGATFGRAFYNGVVSGDSGVAGAVELTHILGPALGPLAGSELYVFGDSGKVWFEDRPGLLVSELDLTSAGAGVRLRIGKKTMLALEAANAVDGVDETNDDHDWRGTVSLQSGF